MSQYQLAAKNSNSGLFIVFFCFYMPFIKVEDLGYLGYFPFIYLGFFSVYFILSLRGGTVSKEFVLVAFIFTLFPLYLIAQLLWVEYYDYRIYASIFHTYLVILSSFGIVSYLTKKYGECTPHKIMQFIFYSGVLHGLIMLLFFSFPSIRDFAYSWIYISSYGDESSFLMKGIRNPGLVSSSGDSVSFMQGIAFLTGLILFLEIKGKGFQFFFKYLFCFIVLLASLIISSRSGFVIVIAAAFIYIFMKGFQVFLTLVIEKRFFVRLLVIIILFFVVVSVLLSYLDFLLQTRFSSTISRAFEFYIRYTNGEGFSTSSSDSLLNEHYFMPETLKQFLIGLGTYSRPEVLSDSGVVKMIFGGGVIGAIISMLPMVVLAVVTHRVASLKVYAAYIWILFFVFILTNMKLDQYFGRTFAFHSFILVVIAILVSKKYVYEKKH